jgi:hypothetical protein
MRIRILFALFRYANPDPASQNYADPDLQPRLWQAPYLAFAYIQAVSLLLLARVPSAPEPGETS